MTPIAPCFRGIPPRNLPREGRESGRNSSKLLIFILLLGPLACSAAPDSKRDRDLLAELREENARLEERLTELQERDLKGDRSSREQCVKKSQIGGGDRQSEAFEDTARSDKTLEGLPVVRLSPDAGPEAEGAEEEFAQAPSLSALELEEGRQDASTRPVLKVSGTDEGRVYHRPLNSDERKASTNEQATTN